MGNESSESHDGSTIPPQHTLGPWHCASTLMPECQHPSCKDGAFGQPAALGSRFCYWHDKLMNPRLSVLDGYDSRANTGHAGKNRNRYPWDTWLDGQPRTLTQGTDYATNTPNMVRATRSAAKRAGVTVTLIPSADSLTIQAQRAEGAA